MAHKRNLAAPFQAKSDTHKHSNGQQKIVVNDGFVNFRNHNFPPLERIHDLRFNTYCGPTPESNWVIPSVLLVGAYPASEDDEDTFELITSILKHGITKFVCLQSEYQAGVPRVVWRAGGALRPYFEDVQEIVAQKDVIAEFEGHNVVHIDQLLFEHCPIIDCGVTDDSKVVALAQALVRDISEGQVIYLHCWGGHGRTGTVVCIMLHLLYGMSAKQAFEYCQAVHDLRTCPVEVGSPQTQSQRQQVVRVIAALMHEHEVRKAAQEEESVKRFHAELQQQVLDRERAAANKSSAASQCVVSGVPNQQVSAVTNTHSPYKGANGAHSGPPLSPPVAIMKPNVVVRETTQEHIFSMSKQNSLGLSQGNSQHLSSTSNTNGTSKISNPVNNNNHFGRKKQNSGAQATPSSSVPTSALTPVQGSGQAKMTSFPAILGKQTSSSMPSTPMGSSALQDYSADTSEMSSGGSGASYHSRNSGDSTPQKATPPGTSAAGTPNASDSSAAALLQTLQAHPPRSPPPHLSPRVENLQKLHSRGTSSPSCSEDHMVGEVYIPPSSDEGDNDHTEDDEEGFIAHAVNTMSSVGGKIPLYQHFAANRFSSEHDAASSPMQIQISDNEIEDGFDMDTELSATTTRDRDNMVGYISGTSTDSRPMSIVQDSPTVSGMMAAEGLSTMTSTVTTDSLGVTGVNTPSSRAQGATPPGAYINYDRDQDAQGSASASYVTANASACADTGAGQTNHLDDQQDSALDDVSDLRGAEATNSTAAAPSSRSASSDGASSSPKTRRLSGSKVLSNAFKAGIKMFTGGSSSSSSSSTTTPTATASAVKSDPKQGRSISSDSGPVKGYPDIHLNSLKTASTDSVASYATVIATSTSNASTPTSSRTVYDESGSRQEASVSQRATVEPTPPKGQVPAQRGPLKGGRS